jgi:medium-chain acyl-[acyl-carrier-protein] hydrolase
MQALLPMLRADFAVNETYVYSPGEPLDIPITVFGGTHDPEVYRDELDAWRCHTTAAIKLHTFPGNHFFLRPMQSDLISAIVSDLSGLKPPLQRDSMERQCG